MSIFTGSSRGFTESRANRGLPSLFDALYVPGSSYIRPEYLSLIGNPEDRDLYIGINPPTAYDLHKFESVLKSSRVWGRFKSVTIGIETPNFGTLAAGLRFYRDRITAVESEVVDDILEGKYPIKAPRAHTPLVGYNLSDFESKISFVGVDHKFLLDSPQDYGSGTSVGLIHSGSRAKKFSYQGESTRLKTTNWTSPESVDSAMSQLSYVVLGLSRANKPVWSPWALAALNHGKPLVSVADIRRDIYLSPSSADSMSSEDLFEAAKHQSRVLSTESKEYNENPR